MSGGLSAISIPGIVQIASGRRNDEPASAKSGYFLDEEASWG
jgi:hypothetical protein